MTTDPAYRTRSVGTVAWAILVWLVGCQSPTEPEVLTEVYDQAVGGATVHVLSACEAPLDRTRIERELRTAAARIEREGSTLDCIDGMVMHFSDRYVGGHAELIPYGQVEIGCGAWGAVEHEPGHFCAYWGDPYHHCWKLVWHHGLKLGSCR